MGKLILLERAREEAAREALAGASVEVDRARSVEREAEERRRSAVEAAEASRRAPLGVGAPAQILLFQSRAQRQLERIATAVELRVAELKNQRITAEQARARVQARWEAARKRRERLEEKRAAARAEARRRMEEAAEREQDDRPVRPEDDG
jgi:hypothetical protein